MNHVLNTYHYPVMQLFIYLCLQQISTIHVLMVVNTKPRTADFFYMCTHKYTMKMISSDLVIVYVLMNKNTSSHLQQSTKHAYELQYESKIAYFFSLITKNSFKK